MKYTNHPVAALFPEPRYEPGDLIVTYGSHIIFGYDLYCRLVSLDTLVAPPLAPPYQGDDVISYIVEKHRARCDLAPHQRAIIAAQMINDTSHAQSSDPDIVKADRARSLMDVSPAQLGRARTVLRIGIQPLVDQAWEGMVSLAHASEVACSSTRDEQEEFVASVRVGKKPPRMAGKPHRAARKTVSRERPYPSKNRRDHEGQLRQLGQMLSAALIPFEHLEGAWDIDTSVDPESAKEISQTLSLRIQALNRLNRLVKEIAQ